MTPSIHRFSRRAIARASIITGICFATVAALTVSSSGQLGGAQRNQQRPTAGKVVTEAPRSLDQEVTVMVEMQEPAAGVLFGQALKVAQAEAAAQGRTVRPPRIGMQARDIERVQISSTAAAQVQNQVSRVDAQQRAVLPALAASNISARVLYRTQRATNGIVAMVGPDKLTEIAKLPGVKAVRIMSPLYPSAPNSIDFIGARSFWNKAYSEGVGIHGEGIRVAVIDSGIDYIHTNFGGPGTQEAYDSVTDQGPVPNAYYPSEKVYDGYDFAGDTYNATASDPGYQPIPQPDENPLDTTNGHGTGVASVVGGYGVNFGGSRYAEGANYDSATPLASMKVAPGVAPLSRIMALKVFGKEGGTFLAAQAVDHAMDPNGDGDFSDRVDVMNLSLGLPMGFEEDPNALAVRAAADAGIVVVCAAGNDGDTYYVVGSPSVAGNTISVAAAFNDQAGFVYDGIATFSSPAPIAGGKAYGVFLGNSPRPPAQGITGDVVYGRPANGGPSPAPNATPNEAPLDNAEHVAGKICLLDRGASTFEQKARRAQASGAIALLIAQNSSENPFAGTLGTFTPTIPVMMITQFAANNIKNAAQFDPTTGVAANQTTCTITNANGVINPPNAPPPAPYTLPSYSSRGPSASDNSLKPDLTAPAEVVGVASSRTGTGVRLFNGTSSASPHVAGAMALMKQLHPDWSVKELQALAINTATRDLFTTSPGPSPSPTPSTRVGIGRVGTGSIDLEKASRANVVAYNDSDIDAVNISFGSVEVPIDGSVELSKTLKLVNKGSTPVTYNVSATGVTTVGTAHFNTSSPTTFTVPANGEYSLPVFFRATGSTLRHTRDASVASTQNGAPRQWLTERTAYWNFTPTGNSTEPPIRVALYAAPKPAAAMRAVTNSVVPTGNTGTFEVSLTGVGINTGGSTASGGIISLVKAFELQYVHPSAGGASASEADRHTLKHVGVTSDVSNYPETPVISFGVDTFGDSAVPMWFAADREIYIDTDEDEEADFLLVCESLGRALGAGQDNVYVSALYDLTEGGGSLQYFLNAYPASTLDTNAFNNSAMVLSVDATALGLFGEGGDTKFQYLVQTYGREAGSSTPPISETGWLTYDVANPGLDASIGFGAGGEPNMLADLPGENFPVAYNGANYQANGSQGLLLIHLHNGAGNRSEVVNFEAATIRDFDPKSGPIGTRVTILGTNFGPGTAVTFTPDVPAPVTVVNSETILTTVPPGATTGPITVSNPAGSDSSADLDDPDTAGTNEGVFVVSPVASPSPSPSPVSSPTRVRAGSGW